MKHANYTVQKYKHLIPKPLWEKLISPMGKTVLGLYEFTFGTGWLKSVWKGRPVSPYNKAIPWLSYPLIELLESAELEGRRILEFGGGNSTIYFLRRGASVDCVEIDEAWQKEIEYQLTVAERQRLRWFTFGSIVREHILHANNLLNKLTYDLVLIDMNPMSAYVRFTLDYIHTPLLIVDNQEIPEAERDTFFRDGPISQWPRIDFVGFGPGNATQQCTSIYMHAGLHYTYMWLFTKRAKDLAISFTSQQFKAKS